ncbi:alpha/beta hydrolase fold domain-containing protein [Brachybacterium sp. AOP43-C2-M15]|uniref:alpha/beta hydrolase fold domain-containing protein n=1 Tax=Brachybacterium sp. AOP43-C2-M15 TaxID=3457661 RepID=UPI0040338711
MHAAWQRMHAHIAELRIAAGWIAIGGVSAGGGLAAGLAQRLHDEGGAHTWLAGAHTSPA